MSYDNTKMDAAITKWIKRDCRQGSGETDAGDLLESFEKYCSRTGALKRSPGRVAFGKALRRRDYEKRKVCGLTYWAGLVIAKPLGMTTPRQNAKSPDTERLRQHQKFLDKTTKTAKDKLAERETHAAAVQERMKAENKKHNQAVGLGSKPG